MLKVVWDYEANRTLRRQRRKIAIETYTNQYTTEYFVHKKSYLQPAATENVIGWIPPTIGWHQINKSERMEWRLAPSIYTCTRTQTHTNTYTLNFEKSRSLLCLCIHCYSVISNFSRAVCPTDERTSSCVPYNQFMDNFWHYRKKKRIQVLIWMMLMWRPNGGHIQQIKKVFSGFSRFQ